MLRAIFLILLSTVLTGCSFFHVHKLDVEQGNIISQENAGKLHRGMSPDQVKSIMGTPLLINLFAPHRVNYIYTIQEGYGDRKTTRLTCVFQHNRLIDIIRG